MSFDDMFTTILLTGLSIIFISVLIVLLIIDRVKYQNLKYWLVGAVLQIFSSGLFVLREFITHNILNTSVTFIGNIILLLSYIIMTHSFLKLIDRKLNKYVSFTFGLILTILLFYSTVLTYNGSIITLVVMFSLIFSNLVMLFSLNYKKNRIQKLRWFSYTMTNTIALVYVVLHCSYLVILKGNPISSFLLFKGENMLLKSVILLGTTNTIGILTSMNGGTQSYIDLESDIFSEMFYNVPFMVLVVDRQEGLIRYINPAISNVLGYSKEELVNKKRLEFLYKDKDIHERIKKDFLENKEIVEEETLLNKKNGQELYGSISITPMLFEEGTYFIVSILNITDSVKIRQGYKQMAMYDELTKLPNRRPFNENFKLKVKENEKFVLMMLDIDNFKDINDTYGHQIGDEILIYIADKLKKYNKGSDTVSRYGGDEFVIMLSAPNHLEIEHKVDKILDIFKDRVKIGKYLIKIDMSLGYSCFPLDGKNIATLLDKADKALYKAKESLGDISIKYSKEQCKNKQIKV